MPNLSAVFKDEVRRLSRKEFKSQAGSQQKVVARYRSEIASLKKQVGELSRRLKAVEKAGGRRSAAVEGNDRPQQEDAGSRPRFSPGWVKKHRDKLGLSAADYGKLVGVSALTIYNWEKGSSFPRTRQLLAWGDVRTLGKRDALKKLEAANTTDPAPAEAE